MRPNGSVRNRTLYRPFGRRIVNEGQSLEHGFAGGAVLPGGSLYVLGPRLYHADSGHFYEPDPCLGDPQEPRTMQSYGYALGDPLRYTDPTGLQPVCDRPGGCGSALPPLFGNPFGSFPGPVQPRWLHEPVSRATGVPRAPDVGAQPDTLPRDSDGRKLFDLRSLDELIADFNELAGDLRRLEDLREMQEAELRDRLAALESAFEPGALARRFGGPFIAERGGLLGAFVEATVLTAINIFELNQEVAALRGDVVAASSELEITNRKLLQTRRRVDNLGRIIGARRAAPPW